MVKNHNFYILSFLLFTPLVYPQWHWQNPLPQGNSLYSVQFVNDSLVWASGTTGTLLKSTDSGESWEFLMLQERMYVHDIFFIDGETGWICGGSEDFGSSYIWATTNGGLTWENQYTQNQGGHFQSIVFANRNIGWAAGYYTNILHTTNGGQNWFIQADAATDILSIFLLDSLYLWASRSGTSTPTLKTSNGGINWIPDSTIMWANDIHFLDTLVGWAAGWSYISKTTDGGLSWDQQYYKFQEEWVDIFMLDENYGWVVSNASLIIATTNGGQDWIEQNNPTAPGLTSISFKDSMNGVTGGYFASLLKTTNGGINWQNKTSTITDDRLDGLCFINKDTGWVTGDNGTILTTTNGGYNWTHQNTAVTNFLVSIDFVNNVEGWVVGEDGIILKTTNAGDTWNNVNSPTTLYLGDIDFTNYPIGWIIGGDVLTEGKLFKTTNAGNSWNTITSISLPPGGYEIQFTSDNIGWIMSGSATVGGEQRLYRTYDGGDNWEILLSNNSDTTFRAMYFSDNSTGWISTFPEQRIFHTTDGGINWERFEAPSILRSIYFIDSQKGWGGASTGEIYTTMDGGRNWVAQKSPMDNPITKIFFFDDNNGWAVGYIGNIIHTSNGGVSFVESEPSDVYPDNFNLYQNYPNPFNPTTKIRFEIPQATSVKIKPYDILGREITTLLNEDKPAGYYEIQFDASKYNLTSGVYFYQLNSGRFYYTKKMILLK